MRRATLVLSLAFLSLSPAARADSAVEGCERGEYATCVDAAAALRGTDDARAVRLLDRACSVGNRMDACGAEASILSTNPNPALRDPAKATALATKACDADDGLGCLVLGLADRGGPGVEIVASTRVAFLEKSCALRFALSCDHAAKLLTDGAPGLPPDPARAEKQRAEAQAIRLAACKGGDANACSQLDRTRLSPADREALQRDVVEQCKRTTNAAANVTCYGIAVDLEEKQPAQALAIFGAQCARSGAACKEAHAVGDKLLAGATTVAERVAVFTALCDGGSDDDCVRAGDGHLRGLGMKIDFAEAARLWKGVCRKNPNDLWCKSLTQDAGQRDYLVNTCLKNDLNCGGYGENLSRVGGPREIVEQMYRHGCDKGENVACGNLAALLLDAGRLDDAYKPADRGCDKDDGIACFVLVQLPKADQFNNPKKRAKTLDHACNFRGRNQRRSYDACFALEHDYRTGDHGLPVDPKKADEYGASACRGIGGAWDRPGLFGCH